jgi:hypothetical protein
LTPEQPSEEALCGAPITTRLDEDVDHIAVLVDGTPETLTPALDADEELIQVPRIAQSPFSPLQCPGVLGAGLPAPVTDALAGDGDSTLRQDILDVSEAEAEPVVQLDGVADDLGWALRTRSLSSFAAAACRGRGDRQDEPAATLLR